MRNGIMDSALCDCKEAEQTVHHILQDCSIWWQQRHQLWPQDESTTNKLWRTVEDLRSTIKFLATSGLRVWACADWLQKKISNIWFSIIPFGRSPTEFGLFYRRKLKKKSKCLNHPYALQLWDCFAVSSLSQSANAKVWAISCQFTTEQLHKF